MCAPCAAGAALRAARQTSGQATILLGQPNTVGEPCEYEPNQLKDWRIKLLCAKDNALFLELPITAHKLNSYIGIVVSAINYNTNPCYFKKQLDEIAEFMAVLVNNGKC